MRKNHELITFISIEFIYKLHFLYKNMLFTYYLKYIYNTGKTRITHFYIKNVIYKSIYIYIYIYISYTVHTFAAKFILNVIDLLRNESFLICL